MSKPDHATFPMTIKAVLIDHAIDLHDHRAEHGLHEDESAFFDRTVKRLEVLFKKQFRKEGWTPPADIDLSLTPGE